MSTQEDAAQIEAVAEQIFKAMCKSDAPFFRRHLDIENISWNGPVRIGEETRKCFRAIAKWHLARLSPDKPVEQQKHPGATSEQPGKPSRNTVPNQGRDSDNDQIHR